MVISAKFSRKTAGKFKYTFVPISKRGGNSVLPHIEVIPCKVCGDKSSGVHYGVITCEGCKGFFRRSQSGPVNYQCARNKACVIDRVNRNRCQFCRLQKCLALGMSRDAVKFGRMSKKQREKVEDEAHYITNKGPRTNGYNDSPPPAYEASPTNNNSQYACYPSQYGYTPNGSYGYSQSENAVYAVQPAVPQADSTTYGGSSPPIVKAEEIDIECLIKLIGDAHMRTCLFTADQISCLRDQTLTNEQIQMYTCMNHEQLWMEIADKITMTVQQIIEFAKMVPGFMSLSQDDQIMLLKSGSFELALLRLCRSYDVVNDKVIFGTAFVPLEAFTNLTEEEKELKTSIFDFAKEMIGFKLTETELSLLCGVVLVNSTRPCVRDLATVLSLQDRIKAGLKLEVMRNHPDNDEMYQTLLMKIPCLTELSKKHIKVLNALIKKSPGMEFPALHKELFSSESTVIP